MILFSYTQKKYPIFITDFVLLSLLGDHHCCSLPGPDGVLHAI